MENKTVMTKDIGEIASTECKMFAAAVTAADLVEFLQSEDPFTIFAPTDAAFAKIQSDVDELLKPENKDELTRILTYHVVSGELMADDLEDGQELTTLEGSILEVTIEDGKVMIGGAKITTADIETSNGVIHVIDTVLIPEDQSKSLRKSFLAHSY